MFLYPKQRGNFNVAPSLQVNLFGSFVNHYGLFFGFFFYCSSYCKEAPYAECYGSDAINDYKRHHPQRQDIYPYVSFAHSVHRAGLRHRIENILGCAPQQIDFRCVCGTRVETVGETSLYKVQISACAQELVGGHISAGLKVVVGDDHPLEAPFVAENAR